MRRRDVLIGGLAIGSATMDAVAPRAAIAQQPARIYRLGFLCTTSGPPPGYEAFEAALTGLGYRERQNLVIERRYAALDLDRLAELAADLVRANVDVIVTQSTPAALAAKRATNKIPIVMATSGDAVGSGVVESLSRPGGNVTGTTFLATELTGKRLALLRELIPDARRVAYLGNNRIVPEQLAFRELQRVASAFGIDAMFVSAPISEAFEQAFATIATARVDAVLPSDAAVNVEARSQIVELAARHRLPTAYGRREFVDAGGLMSYGTSLPDLYRHAAVYVDKILKGANPADLPVQQPTKFELVINRKTARVLGLTVPRSLLARADEVIQ
jgi:putative ABC transport system substrate-binding protein